MNVKAHRRDKSPGARLRRLADAQSRDSLSNRTRARRFERFEVLVANLRAELGRPVRILDVGGTNSFWEQRGWTMRTDVRIVVANLAKQPRRHENVETRWADATDLAAFQDGSVDLVFSNSVIEHLGTYAAQQAMAHEVRKTAAHYWVQTPNYWFPIEPHFLTPGWQWLPEALRIGMLRRRRWGWRGPYPEVEEARRAVREIRLLRRRELERLFPDAITVKERLGPLVKSFIAVRTSLPVRTDHTK